MKKVNVELDSLALKFIFNNLIFNAIKYADTYVEITGSEIIIIENDYVKDEKSTFTNGLQIVESFAKNSKIKIKYEKEGNIHRVIIDLKAIKK